MVKNNLAEILKNRFQKTIEEATNEEVYLALLEMTKGCIKNKGTNKGNKKLYKRKRLNGKRNKRKRRTNLRR